MWAPFMRAIRFSPLWHAYTPSRLSYLACWVQSYPLHSTCSNTVAAVVPRTSCCRTSFLTLHSPNTHPTPGTVLTGVPQPKAGEILLLPRRPPNKVRSAGIPPLPPRRYHVAPRFHGAYTFFNCNGLRSCCRLQDLKLRACFSISARYCVFLTPRETGIPHGGKWRVTQLWNLQRTQPPLSDKT